MPLDPINSRTVPNAAIASLGTSGTSTVTQIETKINAILAALRIAGIVSN